MPLLKRAAPANHTADIAKQRLGLVTEGAQRAPLLNANGASELTVLTPVIEHAVYAQPEPSAASQRLRQVSHAMAAPVVVSRHAAVGGALVVMDALPQVLAPVVFLLRNLVTFMLGLLILATPAAGAALLWRTVPGWSAAYPLNHPMGWGFLAGLYVALGFVAITLGVIGRALVRGLVGSTKALATKGETAFEGDDTVI